ncbi:hypothetical protein BT69DRAFT_1330387 [Atractiella rhizophila]|nr:hypothetical protein BT69DRAFT_1330387 [Atractiella rhizophila]
MTTIFTRTFSVAIKPSLRKGSGLWSSRAIYLGTAFGSSTALFLSLPSQPFRLDTPSLPSNAQVEPSSPPQPPSPSRLTPPPPPPSGTSNVSISSLSLSTVLGISTGIFIKKGLKLLAFFLGGLFVLIQYSSSRGWLPRTDWSKVNASYERHLDSWFPPPQNQNGSTTSRLQRVGAWAVDFVAADVPQRGTFLAGVVLGFRL